MKRQLPMVIQNTRTVLIRKLLKGDMGLLFYFKINATKAFYSTSFKVPISLLQDENNNLCIASPDIASQILYDLCPAAYYYPANLQTMLPSTCLRPQ